ncbi:MAG: hypothetical protein M0C28_30140 [Candidatus Moduliflexus flocculans]|nr:hypothetical protein [Candidatus Moduliflexus flocculans]
MLCLTSPANPTGCVESAGELEGPGADRPEARPRGPGGRDLLLESTTEKDPPLPASIPCRACPSARSSSTVFPRPTPWTGGAWAGPSHPRR